MHYHAKVVASGLVRHAEGTSDNVCAYVSFRRRDKKKVLNFASAPADLHE